MKTKNFIRIKFTYKLRNSIEIKEKSVNFKDMSTFKTYFEMNYKKYFYELIDFKIINKNFQLTLNL
jgi:hypothetical protein